MADSIFGRELPGLERQFGAFAKKALENGALPAKVKELIAEARGAALLMVGGPASAWPMKATDKALGGRVEKE